MTAIASFILNSNCSEAPAPLSTLHIHPSHQIPHFPGIAASTTHLARLSALQRRSSSFNSFASKYLRFCTSNAANACMLAKPSHALRQKRNRIGIIAPCHGLRPPVCQRNSRPALSTAVARVISRHSKTINCNITAYH